MHRLLSLLALAVACSAVPFDVNDALNRIANGANAANLQFPYAVSIQKFRNNETVATRGHRCGGVLISLQHLLTAASCMFEWNADGTRNPINVADYRVFGGANILSNDTTPDRFRSIAYYVVHPNYQGVPSYLHDIAFVNLTSPFPSATVTPLSLPPDSYDPADFTDCVMAGWSASTAASAVPARVELKFASTYVYNQQMCTAVYNGQGSLPNIFPSMICAASYDIVTSGCRGDEGNALVCGNTLTGILALHSNCTPAYFPEIYTRVSNYTDWIRPLTASATTFNSGASVILFIALIQVAFAHILS